MKKIYTKGDDKNKSKLIAKVYGSNVIEFRRKGKTWKVIGDNLQVLATSDDEPEKIRAFELVDGKVKPGNEEDLEVKEVNFEEDENKDKDVNRGKEDK